MAALPRSAPMVDEYSLGRGIQSSIRLNLQHYLWKDAVGFNIHPTIPVRNSSDYMIADVGTGTGIWLIDVNRELPSARLDGFDISSDQFPAPKRLPKNMSLDTFDLHQPLPEQLRGKYDVVHVRLFLTVVKKNDPLPLLGNLMAMLKPGGYLQWSEHNLDTVSVESSSPSDPTDNLEYFVNKAREVLSVTWPSLLEAHFTNAGFLAVSRGAYNITPEIRGFFTQIQLAVNTEYSFQALDNSTVDSEGPALRERILEAAKEMQGGATMNFVPEVTVGVRPACEEACGRNSHEV